jgi:uncharacterized membrane protein SpoIIM required for sporulation
VFGLRIQSAKPKIQNAMNRFIDERKDNWQRLEDLLGLLRGTSLRGLSKVEVREFGELYRRAAADLAIARAETRDPKLINYLNSLVIRAHGKIYRAEGEGANVVWKFFSRDFPMTFRRSIRYFLLALGVFTFFSIGSAILCYKDPGFGSVLGLDQYRMAAATNDMWWLDINRANPIESSGILTNNIQVSINAFALGALFGVGAIFVLISNGLDIGGTVGVCYNVNPQFGNALMTFMVGHGVIELSCIFMAAGAGMMIGYAIIDPGDLTRAQALKKKGMEAAKIVIGCACLLVIAGIIEGFISPSALPVGFKIATGILTGTVMYVYLGLVGRSSDDAEATIAG